MASSEEYRQAFTCDELSVILGRREYKREGGLVMDVDSTQITTVAKRRLFKEFFPVFFFTLSTITQC